MSDERRETIASVRKRFSSSSLDEVHKLIQRYSDDPRAGVLAVIQSGSRRIATHRKQLERHEELLWHERSLWSAGFRLIAGVDEVGRGALAGPLVAAAVVLDANTDQLVSVDDSKVMTPEGRETAFELIHEAAQAISTSIVSNTDIDRFGIGAANDIALANAVAGLDPRPDYLLSDAFDVDTDIPRMSIIKGDSKSLSIAAASVIAKVTRDRLMQEMDSQYPVFGFASNKGYGSKVHMDALADSGPCAIHRLSFSPSYGTQMSLDL